MKRTITKGIIVVIIISTSCNEKTTSYNEWKVYGGSKENIHYSSLNEIDTNNVMKLEKVWEFSTGDAEKNTQIQVNPIVVNNILYGVSPKLKLFAIGANNGKLVWTFDPYKVVNNEINGVGYFSMNVCRGVTYYSDNKSNRLFYAAGVNLFCIDANTGKPIESFGNKGKIDLHYDLGRDVSDLYIAMTSPGIIYKDLIIIGSRVNEDAAAAPGYIRAYDVYTGKLKWKFHTIPQPGEEGYESWKDKNAWKNIGGANAWAGFSLDEKEGIVYAPLGSASYDFYGGKRLGDNLFANSILALDALTGKRKWHFQTVHHDVWDRDLPTAPALVTIQKNGKSIEGLAQPTKTGFIFLLDRKTGMPINPVDEKLVPNQSDLLGEQLSLTQPVSTEIEPFVRQLFTDKDINPLISKEEQYSIKDKLAKLNKQNLFEPPSKNGTVIFPGFDGGAEWGGAAYDPSSQILYINANEMPWVLTMVDKVKENIKKETYTKAGERLYKSNCMTCHGNQLQGSGNYPSLLNLSNKLNEKGFINLLNTGQRMMPAFRQLNKEEKEALATYILKLKDDKKLFTKNHANKNTSWEDPYTSTGYNKFLTKEGYPAISPPWGTLNAINLATGKLVWKIPLGETPEFLSKGIHTGTENYGGPAVTAGGLVFIAASKDGMFRAFHKRTGALLWEYQLPYSGFATPAVYSVQGKQYIVIACGGGKLGTPSGDKYLAFAIQ
jgi:quinoprotein glucose dehydrogenase